MKFRKPGGAEIILDDRRSKAGGFRSPATIMRDLGGPQILKEIFDFKGSPQQLEDVIENTTENLKLGKQKLWKVNDVVPTDLEFDSMSNEDVIDSISKIIKTTNEIAVNTDLDMREFLGIDKALQRISGEYANNISKLTEIDAHIERENEKLKDKYIVNDKERQKLYRDRVKNLKEERSVRLELVTQNKKELQSQFARIKQTIEKILDGDLSLREKIKTVFREHGLTIAAILTSIGLIIEAIVSAVTGGSGGGSRAPNPSKSTPEKIKDWVRDKLKALMRLFGRWAGKAAAALPGIIGSIIAGAFNFLKKVAQFAAEHVSAFIIFIGGIVLYEIYDYVKSSLKKPKRKRKQ